MKLPAQTRYTHSALPGRPTYTWPNGTKLALVLCNNIEHFAFRAGLGTDNITPNPIQSQRSYAWRDYGNRVGLWYMLDMLDSLGLPCGHNVNSAMLDACPEIPRALLARGDEMIGHGRTNSERQDLMWEEDERRLIQQSRDAILRHGGIPEGWMGPYIAESSVTPDLLKEEGFSYVMDWPADDQPFWLTTRAGPILSVPYSVELNDIPNMIGRLHTGREFAEAVEDQFTFMLEQSEKYPLVCSVVLHPFVLGQPQRLKPFRDALKRMLEHRDKIWIAQPRDVARHVMSLAPGIVPGS